MKLIALSQFGKNRGKYFAKVDDGDYEFLNQWRWSVKIRGHSIYVHRTDISDGCRRHIYMHLLILSAPTEMDVDHKDGDGLNNQRSNIRLCTHTQNMGNRKRQKSATSKYKGLHLSKNKKKWIADIRVDGRTQHIGAFKTEENAAIAYNIYAEKYHGEFARYNTANA